MNIMVKIIIVDKTGKLKELNVRNLNEDEIFKKCGYKTNNGFSERACWSVKIEGEKHIVKCYAKDEGRANMENKYDLPPPIDSKLYFGNIALVKMEKEDNSYEDLSIDLWEKIYEKLFGGFEDLAGTAAEDENEIDELENVPKEMKTKNGYLKDGFVVDSNSDEEDDYDDDDDNDDDDEYSWNDDGADSELEYEKYEYSDDE